MITIYGWQSIFQIMIFFSALYFLFVFILEKIMKIARVHGKDIDVLCSILAMTSACFVLFALIRIQE